MALRQMVVMVRKKKGQGQSQSVLAAVSDEPYLSHGVTCLCDTHPVLDAHCLTQA